MRNIYLKELSCIIIMCFSFPMVIHVQINDLTEHKWMQAYCRLIQEKGDS